MSLWLQYHEPWVGLAGEELQESEDGEVVRVVVGVGVVDAWVSWQLGVP